MGLESQQADLTDTTALATMQPDLEGGDDNFTEEEVEGYQGIHAAVAEDAEGNVVRKKQGDGNTAAPQVAAQPEQRQQQDPPQGTTATPAPPAPPEKIGKWTVDEVEQRFRELDSLRQGHERVAGTLGDLRNRVMASGQPRKITAADLGKITSEFGDAYAEALAEDLNKIGFGGTQGPDEATVNRLMTERLQAEREATERRFEKRLVTRTHRDADDYFINFDAQGQPAVGKHAHAFRAWVTALPREDAERIANSWDADTMTDALDKFKAHQKDEAAKATQAAQGAQAAAPAAASRQNRLQRAVQPQGSAGAAAAEEDAFDAGYKAAKKSG